MESGYPADACGAICLFFRALVRPSKNIRSTNWEMTQNINCELRVLHNSRLKEKSSFRASEVRPGIQSRRRRDSSNSGFPLSRE